MKKKSNNKEEINNTPIYNRGFTSKEHEQWILYMEVNNKQYYQEEIEYILETLKIVMGINLKKCKGCNSGTYEYWIDKINSKL